MTDAPREILFEHGPFRLESQPVPHRPGNPYTFASRIGSATVIPIIRGENGDLQVLTVNIERAYYGTSELSLPGGNAKGGHDNPEPPSSIVLRELREETGYGYPDGVQPNMDIFALKWPSSTMRYSRYIGFVRDVEYIGGKEDNPHEIVTPDPTALDVFTDELLRLSNYRMYPHVNAAICKAGLEHGRPAVLAWMAGDMEVPGAADVPQSFGKWLTPV